MSRNCKKQTEADYETFKRAFLEKEQGIAAFR